MAWFVISLISAVGAILIALGLFRYVVKKDPGTEKMQQISQAIKEGALAYLRRQNQVLFIFVIVMCVIIGAVATYTKGFSIGVGMAISYVLGSFCTTLAA